MPLILKIISITLLTFSRKIVDLVLDKLLGEETVKYDYCCRNHFIWSILIVVLAILTRKFTYTFKFPVEYKQSLKCAVIFIIYIIWGLKSPYLIPEGRKVQIWSSFFNPIVEELLFRGIIIGIIMLPNKGNIGFNSISEFMYSYVQIISSILFMLYHLQYFGYKQVRGSELIDSLAHLFFVGMMLGATTLFSQSIIYAIVLHILLNWINIAYRNKYQKATIKDGKYIIELLKKEKENQERSE